MSPRLRRRKRSYDSSLPLDIEGRQTLLRRGKRLQYFSIAWNTLEAIVAIISGFIAGSISLVGFGFDSVIEVASASAVLWRMHLDDPERRERGERISLRIVGSCFIALSAYIGSDSIKSLHLHERPEHSIPGIILALASLIVMPILSRSKRAVGAQLQSGAMRADAIQTQFCMVPLILREGIEGFALGPAARRAGQIDGTF